MGAAHAAVQAGRDDRGYQGVSPSIMSTTIRIPRSRASRPLMIEMRIEDAQR
jgi:hypothetical protein